MMLTKLSAAALAAAVLLAGCSASRPAVSSGTSMSMGSASATAPAAPVSGDQVNIDGFAFAPATLTVAVGTTVTWTNRDEEPHTVAASDGSFHSPGMGTGATFTHTFSAPGTFDYVCSIHPMMRGTVVVTR
ncbi:cupredoxin family copper-binding protein [Mycobacterium sp. E342]|uniref:cupredoxin domain-containing protein n=1 Tax=Mycobacterium sp. E342 TaxID=1834147 RepID=UPI000AE9665D|nr:cupredoxin family copper-binding protein [Mycobacterium sp. E342]